MDWAMLSSSTQAPALGPAWGGRASLGALVPGRAAPHRAPAGRPAHPALTGNYSACKEAELHFIFLVNVSFSP